MQILSIHQDIFSQNKGQLRRSMTWKNKNWKKKYCVITRNSFKYFNNVNSKLKGCITFTLALCKVSLYSIGTNNCFKISVKHTSKVFIFKGENSELTKSWATQIFTSINNFRHCVTHINTNKYLPIRDPSFWKLW